MPRIVSGQRIARSFLSPTGAANEVTQELDFQLGARDGIRINAVLGYGHFHDDSPATSDTVPAQSTATQTLHLETGATEDLPDVAAEDGFDIDTEIFYAQMYGQVIQVPATAGGGGGALTVTPNGLVTFPIPIDSPRNIIHKAVTVGADQDLEAGVLIYYHFVEFSTSELGVILARR